MSPQELWPYILAALPVVPVVIALLSGIYLIISKLREGPRVGLSIEACNHGGSNANHVVMFLVIRNRGKRSTSIESMKLRVQSHGQSFKGILSMLQDEGEARRIKAPYRLDRLPDLERYLPFHLASDQTVFLGADFAMSGTLTGSTMQCTLEMECTHKTIKSTCESPLSRVLF